MHSILSAKYSPFFTFLFPVTTSSIAKTINNIIISSSIPAATDTAISNRFDESLLLIRAVVGEGSALVPEVVIDLFSRVVVTVVITPLTGA